MKSFVIIILAIILAIVIIYLIDKYNPKKYKPLILVGLYGLSFYLAYILIFSIYGKINFNKLKEKRYKVVIENLKDIRDSELAHRTVTGQFQANWDSLVKFIETEKFTITQRRDSTIIDEKLTRLYGVDTTKEIVIIDTLDFVSVKDSLFGADPRYKTMMNIPTLEDGQKFELKAGLLEQNGVNIPVFEASVSKKVLLFDQDKNFVDLECEVKSVEGVNGPSLKVGSMDEINTNGNWPKNYSNEQ
ncbi:MAG: hypothetical protein P8M66_04355 [Flavobacteriaceae bacterium]|jgi:hypothetical protein|nr:hypothetical protein [Flavobacteriaceae bacterium]MDG2498726.1 hypothetical protein [Flavobacteriaceae bacterium]